VETRIVVPETLRHGLIQAHHEGPECGHQGVRRTFHRMEPYFWWPKMRRDIARVVGGCYKCQIFKTLPDKRVGLLRPIIAERWLDLVGIDIVGPLAVAESGNAYILTAIDHCTRWCMAVPMKDARTETVVDKMMEYWVEKWGSPRQLLSDQGVQFTSAVMGRLLQRLQVRQLLTAPYKPSTNGKVERLHRVINSHMHLRMYADEYHSDWDKFVSPAVWAINTSLSSALGVTPYEALFGDPPTGAVALALGEAHGVSRDEQMGLGRLQRLRVVQEKVALLRFEAHGGAVRQRAERVGV
jgi:transposase InsO family protein